MFTDVYIRLFLHSRHMLSTREVLDAVSFNATAAFSYGGDRKNPLKNHVLDHLSRKNRSLTI